MSANIEVKNDVKDDVKPSTILADLPIEEQELTEAEEMQIVGGSVNINPFSITRKIDRSSPHL